MQNYFTTVEFLGNKKFQNHIHGSTFPTFEGAAVVCFIFGVTNERLQEDVHKVFKRLYNKRIQETGNRKEENSRVCDYC